MRTAIYTAVYGGYDRLRPLPQLGVPAYAYTDNRELSVPGWEIRYVNHGITSMNGAQQTVAPMLAHKWWKTHPELACPDIDVSLWVDASMRIIRDDYVDLCLMALGSDDWACVKHPSRTDVFDEAAYSATLTHRYDAPSIERQMTHYAQWHPRNIGGLVANGCNARRHSDVTIRVSHQWWWECFTWSHQDQLSLPVLFRLAGDTIRWNMNIPWHEWWELYPHG